MKHITILIFALIFQSNAFWSPGHMIVSSIARKEIEATNITMLSLIEDEIDILKQYSTEKDYSFIEAANWADIIKGINFNQFDEWHYADEPIVDPDFEGDYIYIEKMNVTWGIKQMQKTLSNKKPSSFDPGFALSFAWRYLLHLVGDLHQPLHGASLFSKEFPTGDLGGNLIKINFTDPAYPDVTNLHALWDAWVGQYGHMTVPINSSEFTIIDKFATEIIKTYSRESLKEKLLIKDITEWFQESYNIAKDFVYSVRDGDTITEEYVIKGQKIINERLALAGYRLADLMMELTDHFHKDNALISE